MDPELSDWTSAGRPETDRLASLMATHDRDLRRVAIAITDDAQHASRAVLATWAWAGRRVGSIGTGSEARARLLRRVAQEARRRTGAPWLLRLRSGLPLIPHRPATPDTGRDPAMASALSRLTVEDRQMLALRHAAGLTTDEIAAQLELTGPGVRTHLDDLRSLLRLALGIGDVDERGEALTDREVDRRIAARLLAHLDRRATPGAPNSGEASVADVDAAARSVMQRRARRPRPGRRPLVVSGIVLLVVAAVALPLSMLPSGGVATESTPTPSPGTLLAVAGWSQRSVVRVDGNVEIIGWTPDGTHVAVAEALARQIVIYDQRGTAIRTFPGTDAAWVDAERLLVLTDGSSGAYLTLRTLDGRGDLLVSWNGQGPPTAIVAAGGSIAVARTYAGPFDAQSATPLTFSVLRGGAFVPGPTGTPLAWTPDGTRLAYLASPSLTSAGNPGQLHVLDAATMTDHDLGLTVWQVGPLAIDPLGRHLLACVPPSNGSPSCVLGLVDLGDGSVQPSSIRGQTAVAAWAPDGSVVVEDNGTVLRWALGDEPVAMRWQPEHGDRVLGMAPAGGWFAVGMLHGPAAPRLVAGAEPPMVVLSGPGVDSLAASPDGRHLAYGQLLRGSTTIVLASLPPAPASPTPSAAPSPFPVPPSAGASFEGAAILTLDQTWTSDLTADGTSVSWGPHVYLQAGGYRTGDGSTLKIIAPKLSVLDITTKVEMAIDLPVADDELSAQIRTDGSNLVVEVYRRLGPPGSDTTPCPTELVQPMAWRILAAPLGDDGVPSAPFSVLDSGTASRIFTPGGEQGVPCAMTLLPTMDVADGLVAYAVETPTTANRWATRVIMRRLLDGAIVRQDTASATVPWLGLSSGVLAWTQESDASVSSTETSGLWVALPLDAPARTVSIPAGAVGPSAPWFLMAGGSLLYASFDASGVEPPTIWRLDPDTGTAMQLSPPEGRYCSPVGASSSVVFVGCNSDNGSSTTFVWRPGHDWIVLDGAAGWIGVTIGGGWAILTDFSEQGPRIIGFPLSELPD